MGFPPTAEVQLLRTCDVHQALEPHLFMERHDSLDVYDGWCQKREPDGRFASLPGALVLQGDAADLQHLAHQREAVGVHPAGLHAQDHVPGTDGLAVDQFILRGEVGCWVNGSTRTLCFSKLLFGCAADLSY